MKIASRWLPDPSNHPQSVIRVDKEQGIAVMTVWPGHKPGVWLEAGLMCRFPHDSREVAIAHAELRLREDGYLLEEEISRGDS